MTSPTPPDPIAHGFARIRAAVQLQQQAIAERDAAIVDTVRAGATREAVADVAGLSSKWVGRIVQVADEADRDHPEVTTESNERGPGDTG